MSKSLVYLDDPERRPIVGREEVRMILQPSQSR